MTVMDFQPQEGKRFLWPADWVQGYYASELCASMLPAYGIGYIAKIIGGTVTGHHWVCGGLNGEGYGDFQIFTGDDILMRCASVDTPCLGVNLASDVPPPEHECEATETQYITCGDGTIIVTHTCGPSFTWVPTGQTVDDCPVPPVTDPTLIYMIIGGVTIMGLALMAFTGRKK